MWMKKMPKRRAGLWSDKTVWKVKTFAAKAPHGGRRKAA